MNKDQVAQILRKYTDGMVNSCTCFYSPSIPEKKLNNALSTYAVGALPASVVALIDTTIFGSAKEGYLFTTDKIYYHEALSAAGFVKYSTIERLDFMDTASKKDDSKKLYIYTEAFVSCLSSVFINKTPMKDALDELHTLSLYNSDQEDTTQNVIKQTTKSLIPEAWNEAEKICVDLCKYGSIYFHSPFPNTDLHYALAGYANSIKPEDVRCLFVPVGSSACGFVLTDDSIITGSRNTIALWNISGIEVDHADKSTIIIHTNIGDISWRNECINTDVFCKMILSLKSRGSAAADSLEKSATASRLTSCIREIAEIKDQQLADETSEDEEEIKKRNIFRYLRTDFRKVFPTLVVATMSSGKSTLINALVGTELLPSLNTACTAKAVAILDNDAQDHFRIHTVSPEGEYSIVDPATKEAVADYNYNGSSQEFIIEGEISGVKNSTKAMMIFDTPGINNSLDSGHTDVTINTINLFSEGLILYLINAEQMGTYDDERFLKFLVSKTQNDKDFEFIFVMNKMDAIDPEQEDPYVLLENCRQYLVNCGIESPKIVSVCALGGLLIKKVLNGETLSRKEINSFQKFYDLFEDNSYSMKNLSLMHSGIHPNDIFKVGTETYTRVQLESALENTGIPALEELIDDTLVKSLELEAPTITFEK